MAGADVAAPLARYLRGLAGSWRALAAGRPGAVVVDEPGLVASRSPFAVLDNAVVLEPERMGDTVAFFPPGSRYAVWTPEGDARLARVAAEAGLVRDVRTTAMVLDLQPDDAGWAASGRGRAEEPPAGLPVGQVPLVSVARTGVPVDQMPVEEVPARVVTALNGLPAALLEGVPGLRCWGTAGGGSALAIQVVGCDVVVSFVATLRDLCRRGLATAVLRTALTHAHDEGARGAVLQATPDGAGLYAALGFAPVVTWQEWVPERS